MLSIYVGEHKSLAFFKGGLREPENRTSAPRFETNIPASNVRMKGIHNIVMTFSTDQKTCRKLH